MRPIDADKLRDVLRMRHLKCLNIYGSLSGALSGMIKLLDSQPTLDYAPVIHAHWVFTSFAKDGSSGYICSKCGVRNNNLPTVEVEDQMSFLGSRFCPNCNAKMDEEVKE